LEGGFGYELLNSLYLKTDEIPDTHGSHKTTHPEGEMFQRIQSGDRLNPADFGPRAAPVNAARAGCHDVLVPIHMAAVC